MKNRNLSPENPRQPHKIPDLDIIDLEQQSEAPNPPADKDSAREDEPAKRGFLSHINIHIVLLVVAVLFVAGIAYKIMNFGVRVDLDEIFSDGPGEYNDSYDMILPRLDASHNPIYKDYSQGSTILAFGNAPFSDDRDSEDNLVRLMEKETGATIYNCSISGSFLATDWQQPDQDNAPRDLFNAYWLCNIAAGNKDVQSFYLHAMEVLGDQAPPEAREVYDILTSISLEEVDAIVIMYDASDYLAGRDMYDPNNPTNISTFAGNTEAIIEYVNYHAPHVRIIVMSPPYAFGVDDNGEYVSSDIKKYGKQDALSVYVALQYASCVARSTTFVDNLYTTFNEDTARKYLTDNVHLNQKGRERVAERFAYALNYYNNAGQNSESRD
ncbi:MAG: hypothetical protein HFH94_04600 [Lachnospiraceae bacterium]|nr:hypothetical protein [uncultured Acetatifactor sp.]MCI9219002.1 hypothetical protein [Lachnospiraceae bacterium]